MNQSDNVRKSLNTLVHLRTIACWLQTHGITYTMVHEHLTIKHTMQSEDKHNTR